MLSQDTTRVCISWEMDPQDPHLQNQQSNCLGIPAKQLLLSAPTSSSLNGRSCYKKLWVSKWPGLTAARSLSEQNPEHGPVKVPRALRQLHSRPHMP